MTDFSFRLDEGLKAACPGIALGVLVIEDLESGLATPEISQKLDEAAMDVRRDWAQQEGTRHERIGELRRTFRILGIDPTKTVPASEALIKRFVKQGPFSISRLVDLNNLCSVTLAVPLGIYDARRLMPTSTYRLGEPGEVYFPIGKSADPASALHAEGRPVLADDQGIFGSPVRDSGRAPVTKDTSSVVIVAYESHLASSSTIDADLDFVVRSFSEHAGGLVVSKRILR